MGDCEKFPSYKTEPVPEELVEKVNLKEWPFCEVDPMVLAAADRIANQSTRIAALQQEIEKLRGQNEQLREAAALVAKESAELLERRWIPVTERLPEDHAGRCLVCASVPHGSVIFIGLYFASVHSWLSDLPYYSPLPPVTHWMPLPEPPEVENAETK